VVNERVENIRVPLPVLQIEFCYLKTSGFQSIALINSACSGSLTVYTPAGFKGKFNFAQECVRYCSPDFTSRNYSVHCFATKLQRGLMPANFLVVHFAYIFTDKE
jgi:hypothetical protein